MSTFTVAMRFIGDLDDEFYDDERQRDVWNEAAAIGFQLFYWAVLIGAAVLPWVAGETGAWIALGALVAATLISVATLRYAAARDVNLYTASKLLRVRGFVAALLIAAGAVGILLRLQPDVYAEASSWAGAATGAVVGGGAVGVMVWLMRRRAARFENEEL